MKKNNNGFTLVELIVVTCIMTIIMGAVLAILSPVQKHFQKVHDTAFQETVCITLGDSISDNIKFAGNVYITNDTTSVDTTKYTHFLKIDNVNERAGAKKNAVGVVTKGLSSNLGSEAVVLGSDFYGNDSYKIIIGEYGTSDLGNYIRLDFEGNSMTYENGAYVKNTTSTYKYSKSIEFTNMNNQGNLGDGRSDLNLSLYSNLNCNDVYYIFYNEPGDF